MIFIPEINPVAVALGPLKIHWYGVAYVVGILLSISWAKFLIRKYKEFQIKPEQFDNIMPYLVLGVVVGGRLGQVLFFAPGYYLQQPLEILMVWKGGMSFHGGFIGCIFMSWVYTRKYKLSLLKFLDLCFLSSPIGLFFGRMANFINNELGGTATSVPWGVIRPNFAIPIHPTSVVPTHPTQIYEALLEGLVMFVLLNFIYKFTNKKRSGFILSYFFILYALFRLIIEQFKVQNETIEFFSHHVGVGSVLCFVMLFSGIALLIIRHQAYANSSAIKAL